MDLHEKQNTLTFSLSRQRSLQAVSETADADQKAVCIQYQSPDASNHPSSLSSHLESYPPLLVQIPFHRTDDPLDDLRIKGQ